MQSVSVHASVTIFEPTEMILENIEKIEGQTSHNKRLSAMLSDECILIVPFAY
jgi:hypothetical protein